MDAKGAIKALLRSADVVWNGYVGDLKDEELFVRPVPGCNHIAWQLGHLIEGEHGMMSALASGQMPPLPPGFAERHAKEAARSDDPKQFFTKEVYLKAAAEQRSGTLKIIDSLSESDLDKDAPENVRAYAPKVVDLLNLQGLHWLMHAGQWAVIRRKLGRPPLY
jgi:hypothetical protein